MLSCKTHTPLKPWPRADYIITQAAAIARRLIEHHQLTQQSTTISAQELQMNNRIQKTVSITTSEPIDEVRKIVHQEFLAISPSTSIDTLTKERDGKPQPILDVHIERSDEKVIITVSQDEPDRLTVGKNILLFGGSWILCKIVSSWIPLILIPIVLFGQHLLDKDSPFNEKQIASALSNAKERLDSKQRA